MSFKGEEDSSQGDERSKCLENKCLLCREVFGIYRVVSGNNFLPGIGPLLKFLFRQLGRGKKPFLSVLVLNGLQIKTVHMHTLGGLFFFLSVVTLNAESLKKQRLNYIKLLYFEARKCNRSNVSPVYFGQPLLARKTIDTVDGIGLLLKLCRLTNVAKFLEPVWEYLNAYLYIATTAVETKLK